MMTLFRFSAAALAISGMISAASAEQPKVEVLHYWTSGSEAAGLNVLKTLLSKEGVQWTDSPVAGGTGGNMVQVLRSRIAAGDAPAAVQMHAEQVKAWGDEGVLVNLTDLAKKEHWDKIIAPELIPFITVNNEFVAVPVNVHRSNWLWYNKKVFDKVVQGFADRAQKLKVGPGVASDTEMGPIISQKQLDRVMSYIEAGSSQGAELVGQAAGRDPAQNPRACRKPP